jgi:hypothetical protein
MKHIVVSGCSFTHNFRTNIRTERDWENDRIEDWTWANWLQDYLKDTHILHNYGTVTHDNKSIVRSIIYKVSDLLKSGILPEDIIVAVQWSSLTRNSFFVTPEKYRFSNPHSIYKKTSVSWAHTTDYLITGKDKTSPYEHGYFHLTGGFNPVNNPINIDPLVSQWFESIMSYTERYFEWFEYINMLLDFLHVNGITKIKFFNMNNNFSKNYMNFSAPPYYTAEKNKSVYQCIIEDKTICNTWEQKELQFNNSYVKSYADKIDFKKYFWFFEENSVHLYGGIIEWSIRNFNYDMDGDLPKVLWREMNGMSLDEQKKYLEKSWYGHTSSILAKKFVEDVVLNWEIFK